MWTYIIKRLLLIIPTIFLVIIIVFLMIQLVPGDVVEQMLSEMEQQFQESDVAAMRKAMGIDVPIHVQIGRYMWGILRGDLGNSLWTGKPVLDELIAKFPVSAELGVLGILTGLLIALPVGVYSAIRQDTTGDYVSRTFAILAISLPPFWVGTLVVIYPSIWWDWSPSMEYIPIAVNPMGNLVMFIIPAIILGMVLSGTTMRMTRTMMLEVLRQDYIRTAWSKGLQERTIVLRHAFKNALIPVITVIGLQVPILIGGAVAIEVIFNLPGVGSYLVQAIGRRDFIAIAGVNLFVASAVLFINLAIDLTYGFLDPRVRYG